jgi:hypothetical protein
LIYTSTKSSVHFLITCYNLQVNLQRFDSRGVLNIQYRPTYFSIIPIPKLLPVCTVHCIRAPVTSATLHDWNQNSHRFKSCTSHPMRLCIHFCTTLNARRTKTHSDDTSLYVWETKSVPQCSLEHSLFFRPLALPRFPLLSQLSILYIFSVTHLFTYTLYFSHDDDDWPWRVFTRRRHDIIYTVLYKY